jgi:2-keto-4-pentenoate hydratase
MTDHLNSAHDDRLDPGMTAQAALLRDAEATGAMQAGWKAGFGTPTWRAQFGLAAPLVGFLLDTSRIEPDAHVAIGAWTAPRGEAEIAMRLGHDVPGDTTPEQALAAVDAIAPAIELVDLDPAPTDPSEILSGNIYHRCWVTGPFDTARAGGDLHGLVGHVTIMGDRDGRGHRRRGRDGPGQRGARRGRADGGSARSAGLRAGDVVILGSIVPPTAVAPGGTFHYVLGDAPALEVTLTD